MVSTTQVSSSARGLIRQGHVQVVALTLGEAGALLITLEVAIRAEGLRSALPGMTADRRS